MPALSHQRSAKLLDKCRSTSVNQIVLAGHSAPAGFLLNVGQECHLTDHLPGPCTGASWQQTSGCFSCLAVFFTCRWKSTCSRSTNMARRSTSYQAFESGTLPFFPQGLTPWRACVLQILPGQVQCAMLRLRLRRYTRWRKQRPSEVQHKQFRQSEAELSPSTSHHPPWHVDSLFTTACHADSLFTTATHSWLLRLNVK